VDINIDQDLSSRSTVFRNTDRNNAAVSENYQGNTSKSLDTSKSEYFETEGEIGTTIASAKHLNTIDSF